MGACDLLVTTRPLLGAGPTRFNQATEATPLYKRGTGGLVPTWVMGSPTRPRVRGDVGVVIGGGRSRFFFRRCPRVPLNRPREKKPP